MTRIQAACTVGGTLAVLALPGATTAWAIDISSHAPNVPIQTPKIGTPKSSTPKLGSVTVHGSTSTGSSFPQGVQFNNNDTVTIDGRTMPVNKNTPALVQAAETPPPKMWVGNKLVPISKANH